MATPRSLRTLLLTGLAILNVAVVIGITSTVYARARNEAYTALEENLRLRADTLAGITELEDAKDKGRHLQVDINPASTPEYVTAGSGIYAMFLPLEGQRVRSPSLGDYELEPTAPWREGEFVFDSLDVGPDGIPCATVTHSFTARFEGPREDHDDEEKQAKARKRIETLEAAWGKSWAPPTEDELKFQVIVAADSRPRDAMLAELAWFLALVGGGALLLTGIGGLLLARFVLAPVRRMTEEAESLTPEDTTKRLRPETVVTELGSLSTTLNSALDRLGAALDRQRQFTADASHELRTPLAVMLGNVDLMLRRDRTPDEYKRGLERQRRIAKCMTDITENLLALARADHDRIEVTRVPTDVAKLAETVCGDYQPLAFDRDIGLKCAVDGGVVVDGDPTHLGELLNNLVSNAVKFTPAGGAVQVTVSQLEGRAVIDVDDGGPGIPEAKRAQIFERFYRVEEGQRRSEGAGLGLAIVDWIVRAHDGKIEVSDRDGGGTRFRVLLPAQRPEGKPRIAATSPTRKRAPAA